MRLFLSVSETANLNVSCRAALIRLILFDNPVAIGIELLQLSGNFGHIHRSLGKGNR